MQKFPLLDLCSFLIPYFYGSTAQLLIRNSFRKPNSIPTISFKGYYLTEVVYYRAERQKLYTAK